jgi:hypothetical protein
MMGVAIPQGNGQQSIQAALDTGRDVYLPRRHADYYAEVLNFNTARQRIFGSGENTILRHTGDHEFLKVNAYKVGISNLSIVGTSINSTGVLYSGSAHGCMIDQCTIDGFATGVKDTVYENRIQYSRILNYKKYGAYLDGGAAWSMIGVNISAPDILQLPEEERKLTRHIVSGAARITLHDCTFSKGYRAIDLSNNNAGSATVTGCNWEDLEEFEVWATTRNTVTLIGGIADGKWRAGGSSTYGPRFSITGMRLRAPAVTDSKTATWILSNNHNLEDEHFVGGPGKRIWIDRL